MSTVSVVTRHPLLHASDIVSMTFATGWQQIVCRWILLRLNCTGLALNTTFRCWVAMLRSCISAQILWLPVITYDDRRWALDARPRVTTHEQRRHASTICVACSPSVGSLVATSRHGSCQPLSCRDWITAMPSLQDFRLQRWRRSRECCMLHWLPVVQRIDYKLCLLVHKSSLGQAPEYISNMLKPAANDPSLTTLRAAANKNYVVPRSNRQFGDRAFSVAASKAWNSLPTESVQVAVLRSVAQTSRLLPVQRTRSNVAWRPAFQKSLRLTFRVLLLQLFYQCFFYYYHYHFRYHYRCHHCYYHHLMLCDRNAIEMTVLLLLLLKWIFNISQGSAAKYLRCGGTCYIIPVGHFLLCSTVKEFWKSVKIWRS